MYDTIIIKSPYIDENITSKILNFCSKYEGLDLFSGEILYTFTSGKLDGSYDYRIRMSLNDFEFEKFDGIMTPQKVVTNNHLVVECSLHKLFLSHNVCGGPIDIKKSIKYLINFIETEMHISLPYFDKWEVKKVDKSIIFLMPSKSIALKMIDGLRLGYYSRRKPIVYDTSIMFAGSTTTNKFYHKGSEFLKHDYKRLTKWLSKEIEKDYLGQLTEQEKQKKLIPIYQNIEKIKKLADRIVRFECSIKTRKLQDLFNSKIVLVSMLNDKIIENCMNDELQKTVKESDDDMPIERRSDLVLERLKLLHGDDLGKILYLTWTFMVQWGEKKARQELSKTTFYRHKKLLEESDVSWLGTTINVNKFDIIPSDFSWCSKKYVDETVDPLILEIFEKMAV